MHTAKFDRPLPVGAYCDLVTPFSGGTVDTDAIDLLVKWQIANGISGIIVCGLAGEPTSLTWAERRAVVGAAVVAAAGQVPVLAGTGTNSTETTRANTIVARELGADAAIVVTPYYNKPSQKGLIRHFEAVTSVVDIPIIVCNAPNLTASDVSPDTLERLAAIPGIVGVEDCTGDVSRIGLFPRSARSRLRQYSGDDRTCLPFNLLGGSGTFSIAANIAPRLTSSLHDALRAGDLRSAHSLHMRLEPVHDILRWDTPTAVVKQALHVLHGLDAETRLPLTPVDAGAAEAIGRMLDALPRNAPLSATLSA